MTTKIASINIISAKAILLATCLVAALPAAVRAEDAANKDAGAFLTATYLDCGTYYHVVSACMGAQRDNYVAMGDKLWQRAPLMEPLH